jgi:hypothetical protein
MEYINAKMVQRKLNIKQIVRNVTKDVKKKN